MGLNLQIVFGNVSHAFLGIRESHVLLADDFNHVPTWNLLLEWIN